MMVVLARPVHLAQAEVLPPVTELVWQSQCGVIETPEQIIFPVDTDDFFLIQPFGRPNSRYSGKLHSGDDWIKHQGDSKGEPVYAIADGLVTYAEPTGWGRDRGVVIVQHILLDGTIFLSLYGHLEESETVTFPTRGTCISQGDVIGLISDPRPAPHLHFEIRTFWPTYPGPGYWDVDPTIKGWENPRQFIENWQAWLHPAHQWHRTLLDPAGPVVDNLLREDGVVLMIDDRYLSAYSEAGRIWQYRLADSIEVTGLAALDEQTLLIGSTDGRIQYWNQYGGYVDQWQTDVEVPMEGPWVAGDMVVVRGHDNRLRVYRNDQSLLAVYDEVGHVQSVAMTADILALLTSQEVLLIGSEGRMIERSAKLPNSDVIAGQNETLFLRNRDEIWRILADGERELVLDGLTINRTDSAMLVDAAGNLVLWGVNDPNQLMALSPEGDILWARDVEAESISRARLLQANECLLVLADRRGRVLTFDARTGEAGGQIDVWGDHHNGVWVGTHPGDSILRLQVGSHLAGFDIDLLSGISCGT
jgi:murein DD-endopeptidase MepM/ murein hydrolase activator NlpD